MSRISNFLSIFANRFTNHHYLMKIKSLLTVIGLSSLAPAAMANPADFRFENEDYIYIVGEINNWDITQSPAKLLRVDADSHVYHGYIFAPSHSIFRFYTALGDWDANSIGSQTEDSAIWWWNESSITSQCTPGKGSWAIDDRRGDMIEVTVDLDNMQCNFEFPSVSNVYFVSEGFATAPNDLSLDNLSLSGNIEFRLCAQLEDGRMVDFIPDGTLGAQDSMSSNMNIYSYIGEPSFLFGCSTSDPIHIQYDFSQAKCRIWRDSFDFSTLPPTWYAYYEVLKGGDCHAVGDWIDRRDFYSIEDFEFSWSGPGEFDGTVLCLPEDAEGTGVMTAYCRPIDLTITREFPIIPKYASEYAMTTPDGTIYAPYLTRSEEKPQYFKGRIEIPAGDGAFEFTFKGLNNKYPDMYYFGCAGAYLFELENGYAESWAGEWYSTWAIPEEFRGQAINFRLDTWNMLIEAYTDEYGEPSSLKWRQDLDPDDMYYIKRGMSKHIFNYIQEHPDVNPNELSYSFEPDIYGLYVEDGWLRCPFAGDLGIVTMTVSDQEGHSISSEFKVIPAYAPVYRIFTEDGTPLDGGDLQLTKAEDYNYAYAGTINVPDGGDLRFYISSEDDLLPYYSKPCDGPTPVLLDNGIFVSGICGGSRGDGYLWIIPQEYAGRTLNVAFTPDSQLSIYSEGVDPDAIEVIPAESNPAVLPAGVNSTLVYHVKTYRTINWFNLMTDMTDGYVTDISYTDGIYTVYCNVTPYREARNIELRLVAYTNEGELNIGTFSYPVEYVYIESLAVQSFLSIRVGEFGTLDMTTYPAVTTEEFQGIIVSFEGDPRYRTARWNANEPMYILGEAEGAIDIVWCSIQDSQREFATTRIEILPADAQIADHIFHARLEVGASLPMAVEFTRSDNAAIEWTSSNPEVASVDENGIVTAHDTGVALITATDGTNSAIMGVRIGTTTDADLAAARRISFYTRPGTAYVSGAPVGAIIRVYDLQGRAIASAEAVEGVTRIDTGEGVRVITVDNEVFKVAL